MFKDFAFSEKKDNTKEETDDLYEILKISRAATNEEIRKAYKKIAIKSHPDRGGDEKYFREIFQAYSILGDPHKKKSYDRFGIKGIKDLKEKNHMEISSSKTKYQIPLTLEESFFGSTKFLILPLKLDCFNCFGSGVDGSYEDIICIKCKGKTKNALGDQYSFFFQEFNKCPRYNEENVQILLNQGKICEFCKGKKKVDKKLSVTLSIPAGVKDMQTLGYFEIPDMCEELAENVNLTVHVKPHPVFEISENDLVYRTSVPLTQALNGFYLSFKHLSGQNLAINIPKLTNIEPEYKLAIEGLGFPIGSILGTYGCLIIKVAVLLPYSLSSEERNKLVGALEMTRNEKRKKENTDNYFLCEDVSEEENKKYENIDFKVKAFNFSNQCTNQ